MSHDGPKPPPFPWKKGTQESYASLVVEVLVCKDEHGRVFSMHRLQDALDRDTAMSWTTGGQEQVAFALITETVRREALFGLLVRMTQDPLLPVRFKAMSDNEKQTFIQQMASQLRAQVSAVVDKLADAAMEEALLDILAAHE